MSLDGSADIQTEEPEKTVLAPDPVTKGEEGEGAGAGISDSTPAEADVKQEQEKAKEEVKPPEPETLEQPTSSPVVFGGDVKPSTESPKNKEDAGKAKTTAVEEKAAAVAPGDKAGGASIASSKPQEQGGLGMGKQDSQGPASANALQTNKKKPNLPEAKSKLKKGGLKTTVNSPDCLVSEAQSEVLDPEQYMMYAQQYAALAQQYAQYAQYCAAYAPQLQAAQAQQAAIAAGADPAQVQMQMQMHMQQQQQMQMQQQQQSQQSRGPPQHMVAPQPGSKGKKQSGPAAAAASNPNVNPNAPKPIMITPYRHNWLISGNHRGDKNGSESWAEGLKKDLAKLVAPLTSRVSCRSCMPENSFSAASASSG